MIIDTHEAVERIVEAGASKKMAEAIVKSFNSSSENLATKEDIKLLKKDVQILETSLRSEITNLETSLRSEINSLETSLKAEIQEVKNRIKYLSSDFSTIKVLLFTMLGITLTPLVVKLLELYLK